MTCRGLEEAECRDESGPSVLELLSLRSSSSSSRFRASRRAGGLTGSDADVPDTLDAENNNSEKSEKLECSVGGILN